MTKPVLVAVAPKGRNSGGGLNDVAQGVAAAYSTGSTKRARWRTAEEKLAIVIESLRANEPNVQVCRRYQISEPTLYKWRQLFFEGGKHFLESGRPDLPRLLEANRQLKEALADLSVECHRLRQRSKGTMLKRN